MSPPLLWSMTRASTISPASNRSCMARHLRSRPARRTERTACPSGDSGCRTYTSTWSPTESSWRGSSPSRGPVRRPSSSRLDTTPSLLPPKSTSSSSGSMRTTIPSTTSPWRRFFTSWSGRSMSSAMVVGSGRGSAGASGTGISSAAASAAGASSRDRLIGDGLGLTAASARRASSTAITASIGSAGAASSAGLESGVSASAAASTGSASATTGVGVGSSWGSATMVAASDAVVAGGSGASAAGSVQAGGLLGRGGGLRVFGQVLNAPVVVDLPENKTPSACGGRQPGL